VKRAARPKLASAKERAPLILARLKAAYPEASTALDFENAYQLLVATILSAQCTDTRVNMVTPEVFRRFPNPAVMARARRALLERLIQSTGFFRNKAKNLIGAARHLVDEFGGRVPRGMDELLSLPGVARKTANVVRGECFGLADGVVVDTHVTRLARRMGLTQHIDPVKIERDLMELIPQKEWIAFSHRMIRLGRTVCMARNPACPTCPVAFHCPKIGAG